ncbi:MAG: hypothetical protein MUF09_08840 [Candidatus Nanopelagicales bacterium]|jgi:hypothetical protein|nr:hypothetical protein [Candidatus Nanopelagicales bacterium]
MEFALVYMWGSARPGRETAAVANYRETTEALTQAQAEGKIRGFEWFLAAQTGPNLLIVRGEPEALMAFTSAPETMVANMKAALVSEGFQWGHYATGEAVEAMMGLFGQTAEQLNAS